MVMKRRGGNEWSDGVHCAANARRPVCIPHPHSGLYYPVSLTPFLASSKGDQEHETPIQKEQQYKGRARSKKEGARQRQVKTRQDRTRQGNPGNDDNCRRRQEHSPVKHARGDIGPFICWQANPQGFDITAPQHAVCKALTKIATLDSFTASIVQDMLPDTSEEDGKR